MIIRTKNLIKILKEFYCDSGHGFEDGCVKVLEYGYGYEDGSGYGNGDGYGIGYVDGEGYGYGNGYGYGYGNRYIYENITKIPNKEQFQNAGAYIHD